jgi:hypothetical protein
MNKAAAFKARMIERGLVQANEWIPSNRRALFKAVALALRQGVSVSVGDPEPAPEPEPEVVRRAWEQHKAAQAREAAAEEDERPEITELRRRQAERESAAAKRRSDAVAKAAAAEIAFNALREGPPPWIQAEPGPGGSRHTVALSNGLHLHPGPYSRGISVPAHGSSWKLVEARLGTVHVFCRLQAGHSETMFWAFAVRPIKGFPNCLRCAGVGRVIFTDPALFYEAERRWSEMLDRERCNPRQAFDDFFRGDEHLTTLGVAPAATQEEIKAAWKRFASQHHPDKGGDAETFKRGRAAYEALSAG